MSLSRITENAGQWLRGGGPQSEYVISSRVRLARNLAGYPFVGRADVTQRQEVLDRCKELVVSGAVGVGDGLGGPGGQLEDRPAVVGRASAKQQAACEDFVGSPAGGGGGRG